MEYKILLTTSGTGSRLKEKTKSTNKALVPINGRATVAYILDRYPPAVPFVVTLGYLGEQVKNFLLFEYPERTFEFVWVDPYEGSGSSLLYSMLTAEKHLQCPFIFHACDTILLENIPAPSRNWVGGYVADFRTLEISQYRTHKVRGGGIEAIQDTAATEFDSIHIGMVGINQYELFWKIAHDLYTLDSKNQSLGDVPVVDKMIQRGAQFKWVPFKTWLDTGNLPALRKTEQTLSGR